MTEKPKGTLVRDSLPLWEPAGFSSTLLSNVRFPLNQNSKDGMAFKLVGISEQWQKPSHSGPMTHHCPQSGEHKHFVGLRK